MISCLTSDPTYRILCEKRLTCGTASISPMSHRAPSPSYSILTSEENCLLLGDLEQQSTLNFLDYFLISRFLGSDEPGNLPGIELSRSLLIELSEWLKKIFLILACSPSCFSTLLPPFLSLESFSYPLHNVRPFQSPLDMYDRYCIDLKCKETTKSMGHKSLVRTKTDQGRAAPRQWVGYTLGDPLLRGTLSPSEAVVVWATVHSCGGPWGISTFIHAFQSDTLKTWTVRSLQTAHRLFACWLPSACDISIFPP